MLITKKHSNFASLFLKAGRSLICALRGAIRLGNANNGDNAGSLYLNGNNAPSNANANDGAVLNNPISYKRVSLPYRENISQDDGETRRYRPSVIPVGGNCRSSNRPIFVSL